MSDTAVLYGFERAVPMMELGIAGYCLYRLVKPFLRSGKAALAAGGGYFLAMLGLYIVPLQNDVFTAYALGSLAALLVMCGMERRNYSQKAFLAITWFSLRWFTATMAELLYDKLYAVIENTVWYRENPSLNFIVYVGVCFFYLTMVYVITAGAVRCIVKSYTYKYEQMSWPELLMLTLPPFLGAVGYKLIRRYRNFYMQETGRPLETYDLLLLFYCGASVFAVIILIVLYQKIKAAQEEKAANQMLSAQMDDLKRHIGQVENLYQDIRGIKHDMANHILTLERLYAGRETAQAQEYVRELKVAFSGTAAEGIKSGNPITDTILLEWKREAEKRNICFCSDFHFPAGSDINAFDISIILNNALRNAVENTVEGEKAYVSVRSWRSNNAYMIEISNSFMGTLQWDAESGLPFTSKAETDGHGYGLSNIRKVAKKYFGDIDIVLEDGKFLLSIMLMME